MTRDFLDTSIPDPLIPIMLDFIVIQCVSFHALTRVYCEQEGVPSAPGDDANKHIYLYLLRLHERGAVLISTLHEHGILPRKLFCPALVGEAGCQRQDVVSYDQSCQNNRPKIKSDLNISSHYHV